MYNGILTLYLPSSVATVGFMNDIEIAIVVKCLNEIKMYANEAMWKDQFLWNIKYK